MIKELAMNVANSVGGGFLGQVLYGATISLIVGSLLMVIQLIIMVFVIGWKVENILLAADKHPIVTFSPTFLLTFVAIYFIGV